MHWKLSHEFSEMPEIDLRAHDALLDRLLHVHLQRSHLFCLTPREVVTLRRAIQFGPQASRVLDTILRRAQDYAASANMATRYAVLLPIGSASREPLGKEFYIRTEDASWWLEHAPALYVENAISDGLLYSFILQNSVRLLSGSPNYIFVKPFHGGGNPLGSVIEKLIGEKIQGICVCDRDGTVAVPPYVKDTTSDHAHNALQKMRVVDALGQSDPRNPFFRFRITHGWGVENYIGPSILNLFFDANPESCTSRPLFLSTFPNFPELSESEFFEWLSVNFKSQNQDVQTIRSGLMGRHGFEVLDEDRLVALSSLSMPDSIIPFVTSFAKAGRHHPSLLRAFEKDMKLSAYQVAVRELACEAINALAADSQINFA